MQDRKSETNTEATEYVVEASEITWDVETDILVAGGGGAGLTAALAASQETDATITVLEKEPHVGGNTAISSGMYPAAGTRLQREHDIEDTPDQFASDILATNGFEADEQFVRTLAEQSAELVHWMIDDWDIHWELDTEFTYPNHSAHRFHAVDGGSGRVLVEELSERVTRTDNIEILVNTPVRTLVVDDGRVCGVVAGKKDEETIESSAVILATDGFGANTRMLEEWCERAADALYGGADGNTGDGITVGAEAGGDLAYMDSYQAHATWTDAGIKSPYAIELHGGIIVGERGTRIGNEAIGPTDFAVCLLDEPDHTGYEIFDQRIYDLALAQFATFEQAIEQNVYTAGDTLEELGSALGIDEKGLQRTVESYNRAIRNGEADTVGRTAFRHELTPPFYGAKIRPAVEQTQGGLVVDTDARVLRTDGTPIENLYAAGGAAMGISGHGPTGYLPGNGLTTALGLGRIAGIAAHRTIEEETAERER